MFSSTFFTFKFYTYYTYIIFFIYIFIQNFIKYINLMQDVIGNRQIDNYFLVFIKDSKNYFKYQLWRISPTLRVGLNSFFELRYLGPVKKLQNGLDKKNLKKKNRIFFCPDQKPAKNECTRMRDFLFLNFFVYEPILSFLVLKMLKI